MNKDSLLLISKGIAIFSLMIVLSGHYFGGNALFFLSEETQKLIRSIALVISGLSGLIFLILVNKKDHSLILDNNRYYSQKAYHHLKINNLSTDVIERAIQVGEKKVTNTKTQYRWNLDGKIILLVYVDKKGNVIDIFS